MTEAAGAALVIVGGLGLFAAIWTLDTVHLLLCTLVDDMRRGDR